MALKLIYEDKHIRVLHKPGKKPFALASFAPFGTPVNDVLFEARQVCYEEQIECFGFVAKTLNMYPLESIREVVAAGLLKTSKPLVTFGFSTGSSPALMYAAELGAAGVIAGAPIYSLDPEHAPDDQRFASYYDPAMHKGRHVNAAGMAGKIVLLYDPRDPSEAYHASLIQKEYQGDRMRLVPMTYIGHDQGPLMRRRKSFNVLVDYVLSDTGFAKMQSELRAAKKTSHFYGAKLAERLVRRGKPQHALRVLELVSPAGSKLGERAAKKRALAAADAHLAIGTPAQAVPHVEEALEGWKNSPRLLEKLASSLKASGQLDRAHEVLRQGIAIMQEGSVWQRRLQLRLNEVLAAKQEAKMARHRAAVAKRDADMARHKAALARRDAVMAQRQAGKARREAAKAQREAAKEELETPVPAA